MGKKPENRDGVAETRAREPGESGDAVKDVKHGIHINGGVEQDRKAR